jgi:hypothetical protein
VAHPSSDGGAPIEHHTSELRNNGKSYLSFQKYAYQVSGVVNVYGLTSVDPPSTDPPALPRPGDTGRRTGPAKSARGRTKERLDRVGRSLLRGESHDPGTASAVPATALRSHSG